MSEIGDGKDAYKAGLSPEMAAQETRRIQKNVVLVRLLAMHRVARRKRSQTMLRNMSDKQK